MSKVDVAELRRMADEGCTRTDAVARFGISKEYVRQLVNRHQIPMRNQQDEQRARHPEIMRLARQGITSAEVAEQVGLCVDTVWRVAKAQGHRWPDNGNGYRIDYLPQLRALAAEGNTMGQIATALGKSWQTIRYSAAAYGVLIRRKSSGPKGVSIGRIKELATAGLNGTDIACSLGVTPSSIYYRAKAHGIRLVKHGKRVAINATGK